MFMREWRSTGRISLTILFGGLVVFAVVTTTIVQLVAGYRAEQRLLYETTLELNQSTANKMATTMEALLRSMRSTLKYGARQAAHHWDDDGELREPLDMLLHGGGGMFNSILAVSEEGVVRSISPQSVGIEGKNIYSETLAEAHRLRAPFFSQPYVGATGRLIVIMSEPIFADDGAYLGLLAGTLYLHQTNVFNDVFGSDLLDVSGTYAYIVDSGGELVFHPSPSRLGEDVSANPAVQHLMEGRNGRMRVVNTRGIEFLAGYAHVEENGWGIVAQTPLQSVEKELRHHTWNRLMFILPACLLMLLAAVYLARRLAAPIVFLSEVAGKLSRGERVPEAMLPGHWNREADLLSDSMRMAIRTMQKQNDQLTSEAMTDPLTGLPNRRAMNESMERMLLAEEPFALLVMDIDRFKSINDTFGHAVGDDVLRFLARTVQSALRPTDFCFRFGGEEFVVLLERSDAAAAFPAAERIRRTFEATDSPAGRPVTLSIGIAAYPGSGMSAEALFESADEAMYRAKNEGRNRTVVGKRRT
ncbi:sensor domain-containing diguanylate cyclase [Paenibacillus sp.]|uniref:sensor domain-containing diguanylate cyclase n=1 Tax=Paenibacillus sp. TaxID=58172 RepID=UPI002810E342|nr:sensor domain-containing diguanylate cyclase [Paenibacillus sp.]